MSIKLVNLVIITHARWQAVFVVSVNIQEMALVLKTLLVRNVFNTNFFYSKYLIFNYIEIYLA